MCLVVLESGIMGCVWGRVVGGEDDCDLLEIGSERKEKLQYDFATEQLVRLGDLDLRE